MTDANEQIRVAIVGAGYWGINLVRTFSQQRHTQVTWVCDQKTDARDRAHALVPKARTTGSFDDVLHANDVDAVVIATPSSTHADLSCRALAVGKHVYVEKPLALSVSDAEKVEAAVHKSGRVFMVGHLMMYHPVVEYLRELVKSGELGNILYLYAARVNLGKIRNDENALWSFAPHDISMIDYLLGIEPHRVTAVGKCYLTPGIEDVVFVNLEFANQQMAHIHLSWLDPHKERRLTVVGDKKMVVFDDMLSEKLRIYDKGYDKPPAFTDFGEFLAIRSGGVYIPHIKMSEPLARECAHFIHCIRTGESPRSGIKNGMRVMQILEAAQRSLDESRLSTD